MDDVDKLTLECFVNKQTYKKYLAKHDPKLYEESQNFYETLQERQSEIESITEHLLLNPDSEMYNKTLRDSFESYMKSILYHLEVEQKATKSDGDYSREIYDEDDGKEPDEMLIDVSPSVDYITPMPIVSTQKPGNPIEYWKKYNVFKKKINYHHDLPYHQSAYTSS